MAKLLGHDICTQEEFDRFVRERWEPAQEMTAAASLNTIAYLKKQAGRIKKLTYAVAVLTVLNMALVVNMIFFSK